MGSSLKEVEKLFQTETVVWFQIDALYIEISVFFAVLQFPLTHFKTSNKIMFRVKISIN